MADIKISELTQVSALNNGDLVEVSQVNALAPSGYTSLKASMTDLGKKVNADIEYTTDLADFEDKTALGAIKETAKDKNVADEYDATQTYDKGDVVIYKNTLYICTTNNTTGAWDATKWTATTVQSLIGTLSSLTTTDKSSLVGAVNEVDADISNRQAYTYRVTNVGSNITIRMKVSTSGEFLFHIVGGTGNGQIFYDSIITGSVSGGTIYCKNIGQNQLGTPIITNNTIKFTVANWSQLLITGLRPVSEITATPT